LNVVISGPDASVVYERLVISGTSYVPQPPKKK
jgi:hypothetical protein